MGACLDIGATRTVIGISQAKAYYKTARIPFKVKRGNTIFKFGNSFHKSYGIVEIRIPIPSNFYLPILSDVVNADIPLLIGLDFLDKAKIYVNNLTNKLICPSQNWSLKLERKFGHLLLEWDIKEIFFTRTELTKLHKKFLSSKYRETTQCP